MNFFPFDLDDGGCALSWRSRSGHLLALTLGE
jgi:hypothetical protein